MELKGIKDFLERYKKTLSNFELTHEDIIQSIFNTSGVKLNKSEFTVKNSTIILQTTSIKKNQIFLFKNQILKNIKESGVEKITDIY